MSSLHIPVPEPVFTVRIVYCIHCIDGTVQRENSQKNADLLLTPEDCISRVRRETVARVMGNQNMLQSGLERPNHVTTLLGHVKTHSKSRDTLLTRLNPRP